MVWSLWPLFCFWVFLQNSRSSISCFFVPLFLVIRLVFHVTSNMLFAIGDDLSYELNTLGPLCLWQCFIYNQFWYSYSQKYLLKHRILTDDVQELFGRDSTWWPQQTEAEMYRKTVILNNFKISFHDIFCQISRFFSSLLNDSDVLVAFSSYLAGFCVFSVVLPKNLPWLQFQLLIVNLSTN